MSTRDDLIARLKAATKKCPDDRWAEILSRVESGTDTDDDAGYINANLSDC